MAGGTWDMDSLTSIRGEARMYESIQKLGGGLKDFFFDKHILQMGGSTTN